jgi:hypothetical protein
MMPLWVGAADAYVRKLVNPDLRSPYLLEEQGSVSELK